VNNMVTSRPCTVSSNWNESPEKFSFKEAKEELNWIIQRFFVVIEAWIIHDLITPKIKKNMSEVDFMSKSFWENSKVFKNYIRELKNDIEGFCNYEFKTLKRLIEEFVKDIGWLFTNELFGAIFKNDLERYTCNEEEHWRRMKRQNERLIGIISSRLALEKNDRERNRSQQYDGSKINTYTSEYAWRFQEFERKNLNIPWYIVFIIFLNRITACKSIYQIMYYLSNIQNSELLEGSWLEREINEYILKYGFQGNNIAPLLKMFEWTHVSQMLEKTVNMQGNEVIQFQLCIFIIRYFQRKEDFQKYIPKVFQICISGMDKKLGSGNFFDWEKLSIDELKAIYSYYLNNKDTITNSADVEKIFIEYSKLYTCDDDFDVTDIYIWELPHEYIKIWFSWMIREIKENILQQLALREGEVEKSELCRETFDCLANSTDVQRVVDANNGYFEKLYFGYDYIDWKDWEDYFKDQRRREKHLVWEENVEMKRSMRAVIKRAKDPFILRNLVFRIIMEQLYWYQNNNNWAFVRRGEV